MRTVALLDFDDVFNVCSPVGLKHVTKSGWDQDRWRFADYYQYGRTYPIHYNEEAIETANSLDCNVMWLTSWTHRDFGKSGIFNNDTLESDLLRNKMFLESIGFDDFDVLDAPGDTGKLVWKVRAVQWLFEQKTYDKIIWFDDQLTRINGKAMLKQDAAGLGIEFVGVTVRSGLGITNDELVI